MITCVYSKKLFAYKFWALPWAYEDGQSKFREGLSPYLLKQAKLHADKDYLKGKILSTVIKASFNEPLKTAE